MATSDPQNRKAFTPSMIIVGLHNLLLKKSFRDIRVKTKLPPGIIGWGPRVVVSTAAFHARVRGSFPGPGGMKETKMFLPHLLVKLSIVGSLRDREVACSA